MKKLIPLTGILLITLMILSGCGNRENLEMNPNTNIEPQSAPVVTTSTPIPTLYTRKEIISSPAEAKQLLVEGNTRFSTGNILSKDLSVMSRSTLAQNGQHPFAVIVSCSDSRVPPEILFDQDLGDLFVIRVAGNVITPVELGSIEYAVEHLKVPLVMVLGHEQCGAVTATVEGEALPENIQAIAEKIKPAVNQAKVTATTGEELIEKSSELNVFNALTDITRSPVIKHALEGNLKLYGGKYLLESGEVQWFDGIN